MCIVYSGKPEASFDVLKCSPTNLTPTILVIGRAEANALARLPMYNCYVKPGWFVGCSCIHLYLTIHNLLHLTTHSSSVKTETLYTHVYPIYPINKMV